ncbi:MAG: hypothetical protein JXQ75_00175 [Phycisphaerae bacterium]|nr:hypothetical protein [Phycisphaerae bacterium]
MSKVFLVSALAICIVVPAQADLNVMFDFEGGTIMTNGTAYMTSAYGSSVTATDGLVLNNASSAVDWLGNDGKWLRTGVVGSNPIPWNVEISFDIVPITRASSDFYVFNGIDTDFTLKAYDSTYGDRYAPDAGALVSEQSWDFGTGSAGSSFDIIFSRPVSLIVFSDGGYDNVAIDNLQVAQVPVPGAVLLGLLGLSVAGVKLRKHT